MAKMGSNAPTCHMVVLLQLQDTLLTVVASKCNSRLLDVADCANVSQVSLLDRLGFTRQD